MSKFIAVFSGFLIYMFCVLGKFWKQCMVVKLENYENAVSDEHSEFKTLFKLVNMIDLSTKEAWEFPTLLERLKA